jgi:hypothetical protein
MLSEGTLLEGRCVRPCAHTQNTVTNTRSGHPYHTMREVADTSLDPFRRFGSALDARTELPKDAHGFDDLNAFWKAVDAYPQAQTQAPTLTEGVGRSSPASDTSYDFNEVSSTFSVESENSAPSVERSAGMSAPRIQTPPGSSDYDPAAVSISFSNEESSLISMIARTGRPSRLTMLCVFGMRC